MEPQEIAIFEIFKFANQDTTQQCGLLKKPMDMVRLYISRPILQPPNGIVNIWPKDTRTQLYSLPLRPLTLILLIIYTLYI